MAKHLSPFIVYETYDDGVKFIGARDPKYIGFIYWVKPDGRDKLREDFEFFKKIVNGEIILEPVKE
jgi:hypothetical protein